MTRADQRTILLTGCSSGIGYDAARTLASRGWRVFAACRREEDCVRLRGEGLDSPRLDYEDAGSIAGCLDEVLAASEGRLDAVFNNGAYAIPGAVEDLPTEALRANFEANFFGWHDLTRRVIPVMRGQGHGRIVFCSSVLGFVAGPWRGAYVATKFALEGLVDTLRLEMQDTPIQVVLIEPGPIATPFRRNAATQFARWIDWEASPRAEQYRSRLIPRLENFDAADRFEKPAAAVTARLVTALEATVPRPRYFVTSPTYIAGALRRVLPTAMLDRVLARS